MEILNTRVASTKESTLGILYMNKVPRGFVIEDEHREKKVMSETRIPAGKYDIKYRNSVTNLTEKYRRKYKWFNFHLELQNVPNFTGIYIHIGNTEKHTAGCQVIGYDASTSKGEFINKQSTAFFMQFYKEVCAALDKGEKVTYEIIDKDL